MTYLIPLSMRRVIASLLVLLAFATGVAVGRATNEGGRPAGPTWSVVGELARTRAYASAVAVETGEILVFGGLDREAPGVTLSTSELFDPSTGRVTELPGSVLGRLNQAATTVSGGRVVVTGGTEWLGGDWNSVAVVDIYWPWPRVWTHASTMLQARSDHAATALSDGRLLVVGGNYNARPLRSAEIYDPRTDVWTPVRPMPRSRTMHSAATLPDGRVLVVGGVQEDGLPTASTFLYEPWRDQWIEGPRSLEVRANHSMIQLSDGDVLLFGGEPNGAGNAERYSWREGRFVYVGTLGLPRLVAQAAGLPDGRVIAVGGLAEDRWRQRFDPTKAAELWDPRWNTWSDLPPAPTGRAYAQLVVTDRGIYRLSGIGEDQVPHSTIEMLSLP